MADYSQAETIRDKERKQQVIRQLQSVFRENTLMTAQKNAAANLKDIYIYIDSLYQSYPFSTTTTRHQEKGPNNKYTVT